MPRPVLRFLHDTAAAGVPDAELLRRYARANDEAAFELLVRRHADAVWAACRRVAGDDHLAEDAFQAAFLALARKADAIRTECVAGWLYRVAVHAGLKVRKQRPDRQGGHDALAALPDGRASEDSFDAAAIHEELARLRETYRLPVVLCDLSGLTHAEAAKQLGWPVGTVSGRLVRARDELRRRLERRGVTLPAAGLAAVVASNAGNASAPLVRAAVIAAGGSAPPAVVSLAEGVLSAMRYAKLKMVAAVVCVTVGLTGTGVMVAVSQEKKADPTVPPGNAAVPSKVEIKEPFETAFPDIKPYSGKPDECPRFMGKAVIQPDGKDVLRRLAQARLTALVESSRMYAILIAQGQFDVNSLFNLFQIRRDIPLAAADVYGPSEELVRWYEEWVSVTKGLEEILQARFRSGTVRKQDPDQVRAERLYAERELLKLMIRVKAGTAK